MQNNPPKKDRTGYSLWIWSAALVWYVGGLWANMLEKGTFDELKHAESGASSIRTSRPRPARSSLGK